MYFVNQRGISPSCKLEKKKHDSAMPFVVLCDNFTSHFPRLLTSGEIKKKVHMKSCYK